MHQPDDMLRDVEIADPTVVAVLTAITIAKEMAALVRMETEILEGETRQILEANHALTETALPSLKTEQAITALARGWRLEHSGSSLPLCENGDNRGDEAL